MSLYTKLPLSLGQSTEENYKQALNDIPVHHRKKDFVFWACIFSALLTFLSIIILLFGWTQHDGFYRTPSHLPLRRPSQYINLDKVLQNHTDPFPSIIGFPPVLLQIKSSDAKRMMHEDERGYSSAVGTIFPDDRHFVVTPKIATIAQFRHLDYGMELCTLIIKIPVPSHSLDPAVHVINPSTINIWHVESPDELTPYTIWNNAPPRKTLFTTLNVSSEEGSNTTEFHCSSGSFSTFEFSCPDESNGHCHIDFWQNKEQPYGGVYLFQRDSLWITSNFQE